MRQRALDDMADRYSRVVIRFQSTGAVVLQALFMTRETGGWLWWWWFVGGCGGGEVCGWLWWWFVGVVVVVCGGCDVGRVVRGVG